MMPRLCLLAALAFSLAPLDATARSMIVFKDGNPVWAETVARKDDSVTFKVDGTGEVRTVKAEALTGILPEVERGKQYEEKYIDSVITRIKTIQRRHTVLRRQTTPLLQQWEALKQPALDLAPEIDACNRDFNNSPKDMDSYRRIATDLGMLRYKDMRGDHKERLDRALNDMRTAFFRANMETLKEAAGQAPTVEDFVRTLQMAEFLRDLAEEGEKATLDETIALLRRNTLNASLKRAEASFVGGGKSLHAFRDAMTLLGQTRRQVANDDTLRAEVDAVSRRIVGEALDAGVAGALAGFSDAAGNIRAYLEGMQLFFKVRDAAMQAGLDPAAITPAMTSLMQAAATAFPAFVFSHRGFPLTDAEVALVNDDGFASVHDIANAGLEEECLMVPMEAPAPIPRMGTFAVPIQFVFNQMQPPGRHYAIVLRVPGAGGVMAEDFKVLPPLTPADGRFRLKLGGNLAFLPPDFTPLQNAEGVAHLQVHLAYQEISATHGQRWAPLSRACHWPLN